MCVCVIKLLLLGFFLFFSGFFVCVFFFWGGGGTVYSVLLHESNKVLAVLDRTRTFRTDLIIRCLLLDCLMCVGTALLE